MRLRFFAAILPIAILSACSGDAPPPATSTAAEPAPVTLPEPEPLPPPAFAFDGTFRQGGVVRGRAPVGTTRLMLGDVEVPLAQDGNFLIGFGRDHGPSARLLAYLEDGRTYGRDLAVGPTQWRIEHVNAALRGGRSSADFQRRRAPELAQIVAAREVRSNTEGWRQDFQWPATGRISGLFGAQRIYRGEPGSYHTGVDIARPSGTPIVAPADGVAVLVTETPFTLEGNLLIIDHGMGLNSAFLHLSRIDVREGQHVRRGERIGAIGSSGRATGPHLHWSMMWGGERIDPRFLAGPMPDRAAAADR